MNIDIILNFIEKAGIKKATFEKKVGLSNGYLSNMKKSNSEIQPDKLMFPYC